MNGASPATSARPLTGRAPSRRDRHGLEVLDRAECLRLLATKTIGRVGLSSGALPVILPVAFHLDGGRILVRTGVGAKLLAALRGAVVCFEVDDVDEERLAGWSVLVTGTARELTGPDADSLPPHPWAVEADHVVAIDLELVTGRRVGLAS